MVTTLSRFGRSTPDAAFYLTRDVPDCPPAEPGVAPAVLSVSDLLTELHWRERHLEVRDAVLAVVNRATSLDAALQASLDEICSGLDWDAGAVYLINGDAGTFDLTVQRGLGDRAVTAMRALPLGQWPLAAIVAGDDAQRFDRLDVRPEAPAWARAAGIIEWIGAPLRSPDGTLGVICVASHRERAFAWNDAALLKAVGYNLGVAVDHLRTHLQIQAALSERSAQWAALYEMSAALPQASESDGLLEEIVRRSTQLLGARGGGLTLLDVANGDLVITVIHGSHLPVADMVGRRLKLGEGISGQAILRRQPVILDSYATWVESVPGLAGKIPDAALAVPLISDGRAIGALILSDDTPGRRFTQDDAQTLSLFAQQAATALEGVRRRQQEGVIALNAERARLAHDLHDGLAQDLAALLLRADACQALLGEGNEALRGQLEIISVGLQRTIRDARATIFALRSGDLEGCSLENGLRAEAVRFERQTGVPVAFSMIGADCQGLSYEHELALLRLTQEALTNVRKHAQARRVQVQLTWLGAEQVQLCISDDGRGFDPSIVAGAGSGAGQHLGLTLMRERVEKLGGSLSVQSGAGKGTTVCAVLPVRRGDHGQDPRSDR